MRLEDALQRIRIYLAMEGLNIEDVPIPSITELYGSRVILSYDRGLDSPEMEAVIHILCHRMFYIKCRIYNRIENKSTTTRDKLQLMLENIEMHGRFVHHRGINLGIDVILFEEESDCVASRMMMEMDEWMRVLL